MVSTLPSNDKAEEQNYLSPIDIVTPALPDASDQLDWVSLCHQTAIIKKVIFYVFLVYGTSTRDNERVQRTH